MSPMRLRQRMSDNLPGPEPTHEDKQDDIVGDAGTMYHKPKTSATDIPLSSTDSKLFFSQFFGKPSDQEVYESDLITSIQFDQAGDLLAVGDRGGRITLYNRKPVNGARTVNYKPYLVFQSHEPEFDYLKSLEIEEKVSKINWLPQTTQAQRFLATNDKTIKLWSIDERSPTSFENVNLTDNKTAINSLVLPRVVKAPPQATANLRKVYANAHSFHIHSLSPNSDQETFLSADDLRINLWNFEVSDQSFVIVDTKPECMDQLQEVITSCTTHPSSCSIFSYSTSKGYAKLCDMRAGALCDSYYKLFHSPSDSCRCFSEVVDAVCDARFSNSGRFLATRDYLEVKIWDLQMENRPVAKFKVQEYLEKHVEPLYENDSLFDRFSLSWNASDTRLATGTYNSMFALLDCASTSTTLFETPKDTNPSSLTGMKPKKVVETFGVSKNGKRVRAAGELLLAEMDFNKKCSVNEWHPKENILAVGSSNNLYIFQDKRLCN